MSFDGILKTFVESFIPSEVRNLALETSANARFLVFPIRSGLLGLTG